MVVLGLWLAVIGYGVLYSGVTKLGGGSCSLGQAFRGQCSQSSATSSTPGSTSGSTVLGVLQAQGAQQAAAVPSAPLPGGPVLAP